MSAVEEAASMYRNAQRLRRIVHRNAELLGLDMSGRLRTLAETMEAPADALTLPPLRR